MPVSIHEFLVTAFHPISPRAARQLFEDAGSGVDSAQLLADLADAGLVKGYARLIEVTAAGQATTEVRDGRIDRAIWRRIVAEEKVSDVFAVGSVRLGQDGDTATKISVLGIRFDEASVRKAAAEHGTKRPAATARARAPEPAREISEASPAPAVEHVVSTPRRILAPGTVGISVDDAAAVLGLSRGTVYKLMTDGALASTKVGSRRLVSADSLRALMAGPVATN